ncbi:MAG: sulfite exporter TauE/SafE family protein [Acetobacterales bacterium]
MLAEFSSLTLVALAAGLLFAGAVKGALGVGLPLVGMPVLLLVLPAPTAVVVMAVPILLTNLWQMLAGGHVLENLRRFWPIILFLAVGMFVGSRLLVTVDEGVLIAVLGAILLGFSVLSLTRFRPAIPPRWHMRAQPLFGLAGGLIGGFSTVFGPPVSMYLVAIGLQKDRFVSAVGTTFFAGSVALNLSLAALPVYGVREGMMAMLACLPVCAGMALGQRLRAAIPQESFSRAVLLMLVATSMILIWRGIGA